MNLRPYQQSAVDAALAFMRSSVEPVLIDAAPAAGKSFMIGYAADELHRISKGKKVLCLAPSAVLVKQNYEKFLLTGTRASIFSASAGSKSTRNHIVFATPLTVKNAISRFTNNYCAVIVDEAHGLTPTIRDIIDAMRAANPMLRVLGLTGTPYALGKGYIFRQWPDLPDGALGRTNGDDNCRDPYFVKCVYSVSAREMLDQGFITPMIIAETGADGYDTSGIELLPNGTLDNGSVERAFEGHGRKTAAIVADVLHRTQGRAGGVMWFAATIAHAREIMASLPPNNSAMVTGDPTDAKDRKRAVEDYRSGKVRHIVSVGTLTTGFDVAHTATIALLRFTESASLLTQIMGRAWRLGEREAGINDNAPPKDDGWLLDYANNVPKHFPDGDIYKPEIRATKAGGGGSELEVICPDCNHANITTLHKDAEGFQIDANGYCLDTFGERIETPHGPMPGGNIRRCHGQLKTGPLGEYTRCGYYWTSKECEQCGEHNDIAARFCRSCKAELVDPNEKLVLEFKALKRDPTQRQCDAVVSMVVTRGISAKGNETLRADFVTTHRQFSIWLMPESRSLQGQRDYQRFMTATDNGAIPPETVTYMKDAASGFYRVLGFEQAADVEPDPGYRELIRKTA